MTKLQWHDLSSSLAGKGWLAKGHAYDRLPPHAEGRVTDAVWSLSRQSTGLWVDFESDAREIFGRAMLRTPPPPELQYIKWLDLYARDGKGEWRWAAASRFGFVPSGQTPIIEGLPQGSRRWRLYLPLVYEVERLEIGIPEGSFFRPIQPDTRPPVVIYGTSIVHGCQHVSRPGMVWPSIAGRRLDWPVVNLGFSGSACMEPDLGDILAELDPAVFVVDPLANMSLETVEANAEPFLRRLLAAHPKTPVLLMEDRAHANSWLYPDYAPGQRAKQAAFRRLHDRLCAGGYPVHYLGGTELIGDDSEGTTDGSHPSDLGALRYAEAVTPALRRILDKYKR